MDPTESAAIRSVLHKRLEAVAPVFDEQWTSSADVATDLHRLSERVKAEARDDWAWLLYVAVSAGFPTPSEHRDHMRLLDLCDPGTAMIAVLSATIDTASRAGAQGRRLKLIDDATVVDVNFCARHEHNTGIQRVVRETIPRWVRDDRPIELARWSDDSSSFVGLNAVELDRVLNWSERQHPTPIDDDEAEIMLVPWGVDVFLPEVPSFSLCAPLAALAQYSGNRVTAVGYDAIPLVSAEGQANDESERFAHYLSVVKHCAAVIGISESASEEFRGFVDTLSSQGLRGPTVTSVPLAVEVSLPLRMSAPAVRSRPLVLCIGSHEPRKNQAAVLFAGEALFREGHDFEVVFVGGGSHINTVQFDRRVRNLQRQGMHVRSLHGVSDSEMWSLFAGARFTVFLSLHEGFGLPVAESLALGVPVLTSNFGSLAEIAALGGCLSVNPRDDVAIIDGFRTMLVNDDRYAQLRAEALTVPTRSWDDYANELWHAASLGRESATEL